MNQNEFSPEEQKFFYSLSFDPMGDREVAVKVCNTIVHALAFLHKGDDDAPSKDTMDYWGHVICGTEAFYWPTILADLSLVSIKVPGVKIMVYQIEPTTAMMPFRDENHTMERREDQVTLILIHNAIYYFQNGKA